MSSKVVSKIQASSKNMTSSKNYLAVDEDEDDHQQQLEATASTSHDPNAVTSHMYLKPAHSSQALDKEVVLHRIRQRKRANKLKSALQNLIRFPTTEPNNNNNTEKRVSLPQKIRWVDDAFAAP